MICSNVSETPTTMKDSLLPRSESSLMVSASRVRVSASNTRSNSSTTNTVRSEARLSGSAATSAGRMARCGSSPSQPSAASSAGPDISSEAGRSRASARIMVSNAVSASQAHRATITPRRRSCSIVRLDNEVLPRPRSE